MAKVSCPKCGKSTRRAGFHLWQILMAFGLFVVGMLARFGGRRHTTCTHCGHEFTA